MSGDQLAGSGMPMSVTRFVAMPTGPELRRLPVTAGPDFAGSWDTCALSLRVDDRRPVISDTAVKGAFPGAHAWSPPI